MRALGGPGTHGENLKLPESRHQMVLDHVGLAIAYGTRMARDRLPKSEVYGVCRLAAVDAGARFDKDRGIKFKTYLYYYVKRHVTQAIYMALPVHITPNIWRDMERRPILSEAGPRPARRAAMQEAAGRAWGKGVLSLEAIDTETGRWFREKVLAPAPEDTPGDDELTLLRAARETLTERERDVVRLLYGLDGGDPATVPAVSRAMSISKQRVDQLHRSALLRLRSVLTPDAPQRPRR